MLFYILELVFWVMVVSAACAGVAAGGDVIGPCTSGVLEAGDSIRLPIVAKRRTTIATVVSASTSTITMIGGR